MFCKHVSLILLFAENQRVGWLLFGGSTELNFVAQKKRRENAHLLHSRVARPFGAGFVGALFFEWVRNFIKEKRFGEKARGKEPKKKSKKTEKFSNCYFQRVLTPLKRAQNQPHSLVSRSPSPRLSASAIVSSQFAFHLANNLVQSWLKISNRKNRSF